MSSTDHVCPRCGTPNDAGARFCGHCSEVLAAGSVPPRGHALVRACLAIAAGFLALAFMALLSIGGRNTPGPVGAGGGPTGAPRAPEGASLPGISAATSAPLPIGLRVGDLAPDFTLRNSNGREVSLSALRGRPVIINFWASWCTYCRVEMPELEALYQDESARQGLVVLAVDTLDSDRLSAEAFAVNKGFSFPILWDENNRVANLYDVRALPISFFIERQGIIRAFHPGAMSRDDMREKAQAIY